jgi:hypothetical protein
MFVLGIAEIEGLDINADKSVGLTVDAALDGVR